jgi:phage-related protein
MAVEEPGLRELVWVASSRRDIQGLPRSVQRTFGVALFAAQSGQTPPIAKPLRGFGGAGVLELIEDDRSGTYRAVYTVRLGTAIYVLHVFQKKSKRGIGTPAHEIDLIKERLKRAEAIHAERAKEQAP